MAADHADAPSWSTAFLSALVHELRTPLASLLLTAELLADDAKLDARQSRFARNLLTAGGDLRALLDDLGELNRVHAGRIEPARSEVPLGELLAALEEACRESAPPAGPELAVAVAPGAPPTLRTDAARLVRALRLMVAAAQSAGAGRVELRVSAEGAGERLRFALRDDGEPLPTDAASLFVPFGSSAARAQRAHGGHSLGLPLAAALATLLGGELTATAGDGGPCLTLALPLEAERSAG
jgi:signal transduction histidine kinase